MSSLPVPLSPVIKTVEGVAATFSTMSKTRCIAGLCPMMPKRPCPSRAGNEVVSLALRRLVVTALATTLASSCWSKGFVMKSKAPSFTASTAVSMVPWAVTTITGRSGERCAMRFSSPMPSRLGMRRSVRTTV
jgi:hypothetical protein